MLGNPLCPARTLNMRRECSASDPFPQHTHSCHEKDSHSYSSRRPHAHPTHRAVVNDVAQDHPRPRRDGQAGRVTRRRPAPRRPQQRGRVPPARAHADSGVACGATPRGGAPCAGRTGEPGRAGHDAQGVRRCGWEGQRLGGVCCSGFPWSRCEHGRGGASRHSEYHDTHSLRQLLTDVSSS